MSVVIKSSAKATNSFRILVDGALKSIMVHPGRNIVSEADYKTLSEHTGFTSFVNRDIMTINTAGAVAKKAAADPDFDYVDSLIGTEDGKDTIKDYAANWSITLNKKNTVENMVADFKAQYEAK